MAALAVEFTRDEGGIPTDGRKVRLGALDSLLGSRRGVNGDEPAAPGTKQTNQRQCCNRQRDDDLKQREAMALRASFSGHRRCLPVRSANRRRLPYAAVRRPG